MEIILVERAGSVLTSRRVRSSVAVLAGLSFAAFATMASWQALADRRLFDVPLRVVGIAGIAVGGVLWWRGGGLGRLVLLTAVGSFARDLRASHHVVVFVVGFCMAYAWLATAAHVIVGWPSGRLGARLPRLLVALCYGLAVGSQVGRYLVDRPRPGWLYNHPPSTLWAHIGSGCAATMAVVVAGYVLWRWLKAPVSHRTAEPIWLVFSILAVSAASAAVASIAGVPDGQIELIPATLAVTMALPAGWTYTRMRRQLEEVRESRRRVALAAAEERRRIQADLHDGAQQSLAAVQLRLAAALGRLSGSSAPQRDAAVHPVQQELARVYAELTTAIGSLRDLVQQIYPIVLADYGLLAALEELADRSTIPLILDVPTKRWNSGVEVTAYFVISEAVGNAMRHAQPSRIGVTVDDHNAGLLRVEITDDGRGEALPLHRGGLRSLYDRISIAGGSIYLISTPSTGTRITALLPKEPAGARRDD